MFQETKENTIPCDMSTYFIPRSPTPTTVTYLTCILQLNKNYKKNLKHLDMHVQTQPSYPILLPTVFYHHHNIFLLIPKRKMK